MLKRIGNWLFTRTRNVVTDGDGDRLIHTNTRICGGWLFEWGTSIARPAKGHAATTPGPELTDEEITHYADQAGAELHKILTAKDPGRVWVIETPAGQRRTIPKADPCICGPADAESVDGRPCQTHRPADDDVLPGTGGLTVAETVARIERLTTRPMTGPRPIPTGGE